MVDYGATSNRKGYEPLDIEEDRQQEEHTVESKWVLHKPWTGLVLFLLIGALYLKFVYYSPPRKDSDFFDVMRLSHGEKIYLKSLASDQYVTSVQKVISIHP